MVRNGFRNHPPYDRGVGVCPCFSGVEVGGWRGGGAGPGFAVNPGTASKCCEREHGLSDMVSRQAQQAWL